jgi:hypothetical protein
MPLIFALEVAALYIAGSYAMSRITGLLNLRGSLLGRIAFHLLILPGVALHETAHYLACLLTGTKVLRFVPFWPHRRASGRLFLGYVQHQRRSFPINVIIGLAPFVLNPLGILLVTALLTPLTIAEVANPQFKVFTEGILRSGFLTDRPLIFLVWAYLSFSFALGSVPSREDLWSVPAALLFFGGAVFLLSFLQEGYESTTTVAALYNLSAFVVRIYALPTAVAIVAAVVISLWSRTARY